MLTWLNPHVYLDTVVLVGSLAAQSADPWVFVWVPSVQVSSSFSHWDTVRDSCHLCFKIRVHVNIRYRDRLGHVVNRIWPSIWDERIS